jgi:hypothetical protein
MFSSQLLHNPFISSSGWIFNFKECQHVHKHKFMGEAKTAVLVTEANFPSKLQKTLNKAG